MDIEQKIEQVKKNIWQAIEDYGLHTDDNDVLNDISADFVNRLAYDSTYAKQELRELFRKSPAWNEELDAIIINGTRTHDPDYGRISSLATEILRPAYNNGTITNDTLYNIVHLFSNPNDDQTESIAVINDIAPKAYRPNKKPSRIFRAICDKLGISDDNAGSEFQKLYAQFADELSSRKIDFKLYVSLNPAHFLTMSNPKWDKRGPMLTSCHSLNSTEYSYNCGCTGYARDNYSFIVFTVADPSDPETLNNRKTTRQIFAYKPDNGLLLQSRLYNTSGGTCGAQEESKLYRDLIQREISALEGVPNLWKTYPYTDGMEECVEIGDGFGGYADWIYSNFDGKVSIRTDHAEDYEPLIVGTHGLCICCANEINSNLYCSNCSGGEYICDDCRERCSETYTVYDEDDREYYVCAECRDRYYTYCDRCECYYPNDNMHNIHGEYICHGCCEQNYTRCNTCNTYHLNDEIYDAHNEHGHEINICRDCFDNYFEECDECAEIYFTSNIEDGLCPECRNGNETETGVAA